jgi:hypothetical protein
MSLSSTFAGALVMNDGVQMGGNGDMLGAFDADGNVRGIGLELSPPFGPYAGTPVWEIQLRSNDAGDLISFKYYDASEDAILDISETQEFVINEVYGDVLEPITLNVGAPDLSCPECLDNDAAVSPFTCAAAAASFGCDFVWGAAQISESCPVTCGTCPVEDDCGVCEGDGSSCSGVDGCMDMEACNYNADATDDDDSCVYAEDNYDCDGNCTVNEDCAGECGGSAVEDECGVCGGGGIPEGDCDCDGRVDLGCGCSEEGQSGCDDTCGSD